MKSRALKSVWKIIAASVIGLVATIFAGTSAHADFSSPSQPTQTSLMWLGLTGSSDGHYLVTADCEPRIWGEESGKIFTSSNYGATWTAIGESYNFKAVTSSSSGSRMAAVSESYLHISKNYGTSWSIIDKASTYGGVQFEGVAISGDGNVLFASTITGKVLRYAWNSSTNTWSQPTQSTLPNNAGGGEMTASNTGSIAYIATSNSGILKLASSTWTQLPGTTTVGGLTPWWNIIKTSSDGAKFIATSEWGSNQVTLVSTNGGTTLNSITSSPISSMSIVTGAMASNGSVMAVAGRDSSDVEKMLVSYDNGSTWIVSKGMPWGGFPSIHITGDGKTFYVGRTFWPMWKFVATPEAVSDISATSIRHTSLTLRWKAPSQNNDANSTITSYSILGSTDSGATWNALSQTVSASGLVGSDGYATKSLTGLSPLTTYLFKVTATSGFGAGTSTTSSPVRTIGLPSAPTSLSRLGYTRDNSITFTWNPPSDTGTSQITDYVPEMSSDGGSTWTSIRLLSSNGSYYGYASSLTTRLNYQFRVSAVNAAGTSQPSSLLTGYTYSPISPVRNLSSTLTATSATLSWQTPTNDGGSDLLQYLVQYKNSLSNTWITWSSGSLNLSSTITGLSGVNSYDFRVYASNAIGYASDYQYIYNDQPPLPPTQISITRSSAGNRSNAVFTTQPRLSLLAVNSTLVASDSRTVVTAQVSDGATLIGNTTETATAGVVTFSNLGIRGVAGTTYTITYSSGLLTVATETVTVSAGTPASIVFTQNSAGAQVNVPFTTQPVLHVLDSDNNLVTTDETTTVTMTTTSGSYLWDGNSSSPAATAVHGVISFSNVRWMGGVNVSAVLNYSATGFIISSETLTPTVGVASTLTRTTRAQDAPIGNPFLIQPVYVVTDFSGNPVTTFNGPITISASQGTLTGTKTVEAVNGVATFRDLALSGINASQMVILTSTSPGFTPYTGDSIITQKGRPYLSWSSLFTSTGTPSFTVPEPDSSTAGTFTYSSNNTSIASFNGTTLSVNGIGTTTLVATFTPTDTSNYLSGETVTMTITVIGGSNGVTLSVSGGSNSAAYRTVTTLTANVDHDGYVTFYAAGKKIPGCSMKPTSNGSATCNWKPASRGSVSIVVIHTPSSDQYSQVRSRAINVAVGNRTGLR